MKKLCFKAGACPDNVFLFYKWMTEIILSHELNKHKTDELKYINLFL